MIIKGPDGFAADVDDANRLSTFAVSQDIAQLLNAQGLVFTGYFSVTPAGANDYFLYIKNTGTANIAIGNIAIKSTVATEITYEVVTGTPAFVGATAVTMSNTNLGSSNPLAATISYDTDITGLTSVGVLAFEQCAVADTKYISNFPAGVIIPQGKAIAFKRVAATGAITCAFQIGVTG